MLTPKRLPVPLACAFIVALFSACSKPVDLKLRLKPGDKRVMEVIEELDTTTDFGGSSETVGGRIERMLDGTKNMAGDEAMQRYLLGFAAFNAE